MLGGPIIAGPTLSRFFTLHVFVIPGILLALVGLHRLMVSAARHQRLADARPPREQKAPTCSEYHELTEKTGIPFVPDAAWKDAVFAAAIMLAVMACAFWFGPFGPTGQPDPTIIQTAPKPDFAFLWIYAVLAYLPPSIETPVMFIAPVVGIGAMLLLPLVSGEGEKHWSRRPVAVLMVAVIAVTLGVFTRLGTYTPWSPIMDAWTSDPIPTAYLQDRTPLEREGAIVLQNKQCRNCHSIGGAGGLRGPALDAVASRMTEDQIIRQVLQGGGNMPAYGNALNPSETTALVHFLAHPARAICRRPSMRRGRWCCRASRQPAASPRALATRVYSIPMSPEYRAIFAEWSPPIFLTATLILTAIVYVCGWFAIRRTRAALFPAWRLAAFLLGLATIWLSIGSPMDGFADALLSAHMVEHLLLMSFVPPLLLLGYPVVPLLRGLPRGFTVRLVGPLLRHEGAATYWSLSYYAARSVAGDEPYLSWAGTCRRLMILRSNMSTGTSSNISASWDRPSFSGGH